MAVNLDEENRKLRMERAAFEGRLFHADEEIQRLRSENDRMRKALEAIKSAESKGQAKRIAIQGLRDE